MRVDRPPAVSPPERSRQGITLLELLGVMLIFFIIWGFVFPAAEGLVENSRRRQASADVHALASALLEYRRVYGVFPGAGLSDTTDDGCDVAYLATANGGTRTPWAATSASPSVRVEDNRLLAESLLPGDSSAGNPRNPKRIPFLEPDRARFRDGIFLDPWGAPYVAVVDANADGWIGERDGGHGVSGFDISESGGAARQHWVPAIREAVYVFSWTQTGVQSNRVASAGGRL